MKRRNLFSLLPAGLYAGVMLLTPLWAQAGGHDTDDDWHLTGELYLWGASIGGTTRPGGDVNVGLDPAAVCPATARGSDSFRPHRVADQVLPFTASRASAASSTNGAVSHSMTS